MTENKQGSSMEKWRELERKAIEELVRKTAEMAPDEARRELYAAKEELAAMGITDTAWVEQVLEGKSAEEILSGTGQNSN